MRALRRPCVAGALVAALSAASPTARAEQGAAPNGRAPSGAAPGAAAPATPPSASPAPGQPPPQPTAPQDDAATAEAHDATPPSGRELEAQAAMERGIAAMRAGDAGTALEEYRRASELVPDANLPYRYAGEALESLARMQEAVQSYETYLKKNPYVRDAATIQARVRKLRAQYIDASLSVTCRPDGAAVYLDDAADHLGVTPLYDVPLRAGDHHLVVTHEGYAPLDTRLRLVAGTKVDVPCSLTRVAAEATPTRRGETGAPQPTPGHAKRTWGYVALGAGAAVLATSAILDATWLRSTIDDFHGAAAQGDGSALGLERRAHTLQVTLTVTYVTGALLAATGAGLLVWDLTSPGAGGAGPHAAVRTDGTHVWLLGDF